MRTRDFNAAIEALNKLQTNHSVILEAQKLGRATRDSDLVPEMLEWMRRVGYKAEDLNKLNVLHITGTKGKGSTAAFAASLLRSATHSGKYRSALGAGKVGIYSSPHIKSVCERVQIDGKPLTRADFAKYFFEVKDLLEASSSDESRFPRMGPGVLPNYFRYLTLLSFHAFMSENVNTAVYEVGIGGEYDSTNVFVQPCATCVTSIGIDHVQILGHTVEEIAWNKAGIFKAETPAYTIDDQPAGVLRVLSQRADEKGALFKAVPVHRQVATAQLGLRGNFQKKNATLALHLVARRLNIPTPSESEPLPKEFVAGLESTSLLGRCQELEHAGVRWLIDGAHTAESLAEAAQWFGQEMKAAGKSNAALVFNQQKRDNAGELLRRLADNLAKVGVNITAAYFVTNQSWRKGFQMDMISHNTSHADHTALTVQKMLADCWSTIKPDAEAHVCATLEDVVEIIPKETVAIATGSLLMVGALLTVIQPETTECC